MSLKLITPKNHLLYAKQAIAGVQQEERKKKLKEALLLSIGSNGRGVHRINPNSIDARSEVKTALEIADLVNLNLEYLYQTGVVLSKSQAAEWLKYKQSEVDYKEFKVRSSQRLHEARFGRNRMGSRPAIGHLFSYLEVCIMAEEAMDFEA